MSLTKQQLHQVLDALTSSSPYSTSFWKDGSMAASTKRHNAAIDIIKAEIAKPADTDSLGSDIERHVAICAQQQTEIEQLRADLAAMRGFANATLFSQLTRVEAAEKFGLIDPKGSTYKTKLLTGEA